MNKLFIIQLCLCQYCAFITNLWNMSSRKHVLVKLSQKKKKKKKGKKKLRKYSGIIYSKINCTHE